VYGEGNCPLLLNIPMLPMHCRRAQTDVLKDAKQLADLLASNLRTGAKSYSLRSEITDSYFWSEVVINCQKLLLVRRRSPTVKYVHVYRRICAYIRDTARHVHAYGWMRDTRCIITYGSAHILWTIPTCFVHYEKNGYPRHTKKVTRWRGLTQQMS
jgi:hypothetical protein